MSKRLIKQAVIFLCIAGSLSLAIWTVWNLVLNPYRGTVKQPVPSMSLDTLIDSDKAIEDLDYVAAMLTTRHPACVKGLPDVIDTVYHQERTTLAQKNQVTVLELWQSSARMLTCMKDAHTGIRPQSDFQLLPLEFKFVDGALVFSDNQSTVLGVERIGGIPVNELYARFCEQFPFELEEYARYSFARRMNRSDYLSFVGVDTKNDIEILLEDGEKQIAKAYPWYSNNISTQEKDEFISFAFDQDSELGILTLKQCVYDETYKNVLRQFFTEALNKGVKAVVVDLRDNPGGNSLVVNEFIRYLPVEQYGTGSTNMRYGPMLFKNKPQKLTNQVYSDLVFDGELYVLTSVATFSSAVDFAVYIHDNSLGTIVGEIPGNMPTSYGDVLSFQTPNAGLYFTVSYKHFIRPDASKSDSPLVPDIIVQSDRAMEKLISLIETQ